MGTAGARPSGFEGHLVGEQDGNYVVVVRDNAGQEHRVVLSATGKVVDHVCPELAGTDIDSLSDQRRDVIEQVYNHARYRLDEAADHDLFPPAWRPSALTEVATLVETCSEETFQAFEPYYQTLQDPQIGYDREAIAMAVQPIFVDDDCETIERVAPIWYNVKTGPDSVEWLSPESDAASIGDVDAPFSCYLPMYRFEGPFEAFREYLANHFRCQARDAYVNRGQVPPEECEVEGFGKVDFAGSDLQNSGE